MRGGLAAPQNKRKNTLANCRFRAPAGLSPAVFLRWEARGVCFRRRGGGGCAKRTQSRGRRPRLWFCRAAALQNAAAPPAAKAYARLKIDGKIAAAETPRPRWAGRKQSGYLKGKADAPVFPRFFKSGRGRGGSAPEVRPKQGARCQGERTHNGFYRLRLSKLLYKLWRKRIKSVYLFRKKNVMIEGRITIRRAKGI